MERSFGEHVHRLIIVKWILTNLTRDGFYCWTHINTEMKRGFRYQLGNCCDSQASAVYNIPVRSMTQVSVVHYVVRDCVRRFYLCCQYRVRQKTPMVFMSRYFGNRVGWGNSTKISGLLVSCHFSSHGAVEGVTSCFLC